MLRKTRRWSQAAYVLPRFGAVLGMVSHSQAGNVTSFGKQQAEALRRFAWTGAQTTFFAFYQ
jgi:hypothetical protein